MSTWFKIAIRNLVRHKTYAGINVVGLALAIAACLLIYRVVYFELSFDNFHRDRERIYRVVSATQNTSGTEFFMGVPFPLPAVLRKDYPQLENVGAIRQTDGVIIVDDKKFRERDRVYYTEPSVFEILHFKWLYGNPQQALSAPGTGVMTKSIAGKYFGSWEAAIGKTFNHNNERIIRVTGILDDLPVNTDFPFGVAISYATLLPQLKENDWLSVNEAHNVLVKLPAGMDEVHGNALLSELIKRYKPQEHRNEQLQLQPLSTIPMDTRFRNFNAVFSLKMISGLILVAVFLLIIGSVNFINLATAQAVTRSREVGVRKALGGGRKQLMIQFLAETFVISLFALILGLVIGEFCLPEVCRMMQLPVLKLFTTDLVFFIVALLLTVTLLAGAYPAFILSGYNPVNALKGAKINTHLLFRRVLVVLQFAVAQLLLICMLVVMSQMNKVLHAPLGFDQKAVVTVSIPKDSVSVQQFGFVRDQLLQSKGIKNVSFSFTPASSYGGWFSRLRFEGRTINDLDVDLKFADHSFVNTYGMQLIAGSNYTAADTANGFVVNETLAKKLGYPQSADMLGKRMAFFDDQVSGLVIGVVKDFRANSLKEPVLPLVLMNNSSWYRTLNIKIDPDQLQAAMAAMEKTFKMAWPAYLYEYEFMDDLLKDFYQEEIQLSVMYRLFAFVAMFISCLGLYGLVSLMVVQRRKEVGIRKVLGASVMDVLVLLSKEFTLLVIVGFIIAAPIAAWFMQGWLATFNVRIGLQANIFLLTIGGALTIAWMTVGMRTINAALANPAKAMRTE
ncbi:ABC transporter permease [Chitinophaga sancti]|uniref:ABC-type antimicrobial peptide transport system, permease component n=1 Tax=Chitinophaga sancti TaxID=1004 RepID=A0A1K1RHJ2_9BACT|nr:ABC transporter permease [Chitinophaga sancti]WQD60654.1 FtsX-like permease family protein [Chitinophaga sancti]WQG87218.1 FtsX-like permease family protein [Chitinophaga sancti]SFW71730.1 ABC-type antimicrobial peptide transport system, permease component [Chitinophaga sancti]